MLEGQTLEGRFRIDAAAGVGGMAQVYRAHDLETGGPVAIKVMHVGFGSAERFLREVRAMASVDHPRAVQYVAHGFLDTQQPWLAMEWLEGEDLASMLARGPLGVRRALDVATQVTEVLASAHALGIVHRDIKPSNVFLVGSSTDNVKLLDFGIARLMNATRMLTRTGAMVGTPGYMAPEQIRAERSVDARADVFSVGCMLFECVTGTPAFVGEHPLAVLAKVLLEPVRSVRELAPDVPDAFDDVVQRFVAKNPDARPIDGAAALLELRALANVPSIAPAPPTRSSIGRDEQLFASVVLARPGRAMDQTMVDDSIDRSIEGDATLVSDSSNEIRLSEIRAAMSGAHVEVLSTGAIVGLFTGSGSSAQRAVRAALRTRELMPDARIGVATGPSLVGTRLPVGPAIDRAVALAREGSASLRVDAITARLVSAHFDVREDGDSFRLLGPRVDSEVVSTLLGRPIACAGRASELRTLRAAYDRTIAEDQPAVALVTGDAGMGKSRLLAEALVGVREAGPCHVWLGRGDPMRAGSPYGLLASALDETFGLRAGDTLDARRELIVERVAHHAAAGDLTRIASFLGEALAVPFDAMTNPQLEAARSDPGLMSDQIRRAWVDFVANESKDAPVVLVLDDVHLGDLPTLKLVDAALAALKESSLFVLALGRPEVDETFAGLFKSRGVLRVRLSRLSGKACEQILRQALGNVDDDVASRIVARSEGHPFYLEELIRAEAEGKGRDVPDTILAMVQSRLEGMEAGARQVLRAGSIFGQTFWLGAVRSLLDDGPSAEVERLLAGLVERETLLVVDPPRFTAEREYVFRHALVRDAAYASLVSGDRTLGHAAAAGWLEGMGENAPLAIAEHFEKGALPDCAAPYYHRASAEALAASDFDAAVARGERAIACGAEGETKGAIRALIAEAHRWRGDAAAAEESAREAMALSTPGSAAWFDGAVDLAAACLKRGKVADVTRVGDALASIDPMPGAEAALAQVAASARVANVLRMVGEVERSKRVAARCADGPRSPLTRGWLAELEAMAANSEGDLGGCLAAIEESIRCFAEAGDARRVAAQNLGVGYVLSVLGLYDAAETALREGLATAEALGLHHYAAGARANLGVVVATRGRLEEGLAIEEEAVTGFQTHEDRRGEGGARFYLAGILLELGALDRAAEEAERSVAIVREAAPPMLARARAVLGAVRLAEGKPEAALEAIADSYALASAEGHAEGGQALLWRVHAEALLALGRTDEARASLEIARDRLLERAGRIVDPEHRRRFVEDAVDNARLLRLAARALDG